MEKMIIGIRMEIPDDVTRETLLRELYGPDDSGGCVNSREEIEGSN